MEIDGPTKLNRPETLKDKEGCNVFQVQSKQYTFKLDSLKELVHQGTAE